MEVLGDSGGGRVTHREKLKRFLGQQVMDQKVKEKQQHREKSGLGLDGAAWGWSGGLWVSPSRLGVEVDVGWSLQY